MGFCPRADVFKEMSSFSSSNKTGDPKHVFRSLPYVQLIVSSLGGRLVCPGSLAATGLPSPAVTRFHTDSSHTILRVGQTVNIGDRQLFAKLYKHTC